MQVKQLTLGAMASNCYIVRENNQVLIVDPGDRPDVIIDNIKTDEKVLAILLTHGHFDHIGALDAVVDKFSVPVYVSSKEKNLLSDPSMSFYKDKIMSELTYIDDDFSVDNFKIKVHHTPGHTEGSVMFEIKNYLFTGDTLFDRSIGRTDFPSGSTLEMQNSLDYIMTLDKKLIVCPGHNNMTTLENQLKINPYLNR